MSSVFGFWSEQADGRFLVGTGDAEHPSHYQPMEVFVDDTFLHLMTDPYEGACSIRIEGLPFLIEALTKLQERRS